MKISSSLLAGALLAGTLVAAPAVQAAGGGHQRAHAPAALAAAKARVAVRVEGLHSTLLPQTTFAVAPAAVDKDGKPADVCKGATAAAALEQATGGSWSGEYSSGLGYSVTSIKGESHPFSSHYYWSFWINGRSATTGICGAKLKPGDSILFFPQCSGRKASQCPPGTYDPSVLDLSGPSRAKAGKPVTLRVSKIANVSGKAAPAAGARLRCAGHAYVADSHGVARLRLDRPGTYTVRAAAPGSIRDELTLEVG